MDVSLENYIEAARYLSIDSKNPILVLRGKGGFTSQGRRIPDSEHIAGHLISDKIWEYLQGKGRRLEVTHVMTKGKVKVLDPPQPWKPDFKIGKK